MPVLYPKPNTWQAERYAPNSPYGMEDRLYLSLSSPRRAPSRRVLVENHQKDGAVNIRKKDAGLQFAFPRPFKRENLVPVLLSFLFIPPQQKWEKLPLL
ncbi:hypothetical protein ACLOJK_011138 [Asimina triloba]